MSIQPLLLAALLFPPIASANLGENFGFGSRSAALAGATVAGEQDGFASYYNPALLPKGNERLTLSWGLIAMQPQFRSIQAIVIDNAYVGASEEKGAVDTDYRTTFGQVMGLAYHFDSLGRLTVGLSSFLPLAQLAYMDTGQPYVPEYVLHRARTHRPQFAFGVGSNLGAGISAGLGLHMAFGMTANANVLIQTESNRPSTMTFSTSLKPKAIPYAGILFAPEASFFSVGLVARAPGESNSTIDLQSGVRLALTGPLDFIYHANSMIYYDPASLQLGTKLEWSDHQRTLLEVDYELWKNFKAPAMSLTNDPASPDGLKDSANPSFPLKNILIPKLGHEFTISSTQIRLGYSYRSSIFTTLPSDAGNYLDPPRHILNVGAGWIFDKILGLNVPCQFDIHASFHQLKTEHIRKTPGDEAGNLSNSKIGAPGYDAGGKIYGGGVSLTLKI